MLDWMKRLGDSWRTLKRTPRLGLALGGGGVRGLAHVGVLAVLDREAIPVHSIAGTSMGAIVGAAYALSPDFDTTQLTEQVTAMGIRPPVRFKTSDVDGDSFLQRLRRFIDVERLVFDTMWGWGAFDNTRIADAFAKLTSGKALEEARIPLRVVATDLLSGDMVVFKDGPASLALQASAALPGFFPPVTHEGRLLADGAFVDLVPADVVRQMGARVVVAVDVDQEGTPVQIDNGLQAFLRAVDIGARYQKRYQLRTADVIVRPEFGESVDSLDFTKAELCIEAGVRATERLLPAIRRLLSSARAVLPVGRPRAQGA